MTPKEPRSKRHLRTGLEPTEARMLTRLTDVPAGVTALALQVTRMGDRTPVWIAVIAVGAGSSLRQGRPAPLIAAVGTVAAGAAGRRVLSLICDRERPPERLWRMEWTGPSFPSRHTTMATLGAGVVAACLAPVSPRAARLVRWVPSVGVGLSRLVLGVHWPTDVLAGWAFGAGVMAACRPVWARSGIGV